MKSCDINKKDFYIFGIFRTLEESNAELYVNVFYTVIKISGG